MRYEPTREQVQDPAYKTILTPYLMGLTVGKVPHLYVKENNAQDTFAQKRDQSVWQTLTKKFTGFGVCRKLLCKSMCLLAVQPESFSLRKPPVRLSMSSGASNPPSSECMHEASWLPLPPSMTVMAREVCGRFVHELLCKTSFA